MYDYGIWSLYLEGRSIHRWRVFENSVLRRIFVSQVEEVKRSRIKLHKEELHDAYFLQINRVVR
jgi:hypothetical protein